MATALRCLAEAVWVADTPQLVWVNEVDAVAALTRVTLCNVGAARCTVTVWIVAAGAVAPEDMHRVLDQRQLEPHETLDPAELCQQLEAGDALWAVADVAAQVTMRVSGIIQT